MTNGKTTLEFAHSPAAAVDVARDTLTLAIAWETDDQIRANLETIREDLTNVHKRMTRGATIRGVRQG